MSVLVTALALAACGGEDSGARVTPRAGVPTTLGYLPDVQLPPPPGLEPAPGETLPGAAPRPSVATGLEELPESASLGTVVAAGTTVAADTKVAKDSDLEADTTVANDGDERVPPCPQSGDPLPEIFDICSGPDGFEGAIVHEYDDGCALLIWASGWGKVGGVVADDTWDKHTAANLPNPCVP